MDAGSSTADWTCKDLPDNQASVPKLLPQEPLGKGWSSEREGVTSGEETLFVDDTNLKKRVLPTSYGEESYEHKRWRVTPPILGDASYTEAATQVTASGVLSPDSLPEAVQGHLHVHRHRSRSPLEGSAGIDRDLHSSIRVSHTSVNQPPAAQQSLTGSQNVSQDLRAKIRDMLHKLHG